jgi:hypothetical protein
MVGRHFFSGANFNQVIAPRPHTNLTAARGWPRDRLGRSGMLDRKSFHFRKKPGESTCLRNRTYLLRACERLTVENSIRERRRNLPGGDSVSTSRHTRSCRSSDLPPASGAGRALHAGVLSRPMACEHSTSSLDRSATATAASAGAVPSWEMIGENRSRLVTLTGGSWSEMPFPRRNQAGHQSLAVFPVGKMMILGGNDGQVNFRDIDSTPPDG